MSSETKVRTILEKAVLLDNEKLDTIAAIVAASIDRPDDRHPVLVVYGAAGTGKSRLGKVIKAINEDVICMDEVVGHIDDVARVINHLPRSDNRLIVLIAQKATYPVFQCRPVIYVEMDKCDMADLRIAGISYDDAETLEWVEMYNRGAVRA